mgnify:FL=1
MIGYICNIISACHPLLDASQESHTFNDLTTKPLIDIVRECYNNFTTFFKYTLLSVIIIVGAIALLIALWNLLKWLKKNSSRRISRENKAFTAFAVWVFMCGVAIYFIGYDYAGTGENMVTLLLRSVLSSFEMFLSKSNLIGIADNCKGDEVYMFFFAIIHTLALTISTLFAVLCFGKRIQYWCRGIKWRFIGSSAVTNVFWGFNERSFVLAHDIANKSTTKERFIFVDFPLHEESPSKGQSFSGILGLFSYKIHALRQMSGLRNSIMMRSSLRPSSVQNINTDFFDAMNIYRLKQILDKSKEIRFFILTDDEDANLKAALNMRNHNVCENKEFKIYCSARKTKLNRLIEETKVEHLKFIDDSRTSITQLKMDHDKGRHPIDYVDIDKERGVVTSEFKALIVGFGTTGQDALRFLYEFSAFTGIDQKKSPVQLHVVDCNMDKLKGGFYQEVPGMSMLEGKEIFLHNLNFNSMEFNQFLDANINELNYVIIATGNDDQNIEFASAIMDKAFSQRPATARRLKVFVRMYSEANRVKFDSVINVYAPFGKKENYLPLEFFGDTKTLYTRDVIIDNRYEQQAREFYKAYCKATSSSDSWEDRADKEKNKLGVKRIYGMRSLRRKEGQDKANCQHCYTKQRLLNLENRNGPLELPEWTDKESILDHEGATENHWLVCLYNVAICEHLRWNASHLMMGYVPMTPDVKKHIDGTCDERTKQHTCIVDWNQLSCGTQGYDYFVVKTTVQIAKQNE